VLVLLLISILMAKHAQCIFIPNVKGKLRCRSPRQLPHFTQVIGDCYGSIFGIVCLAPPWRGYSGKNAEHHERHIVVLGRARGKMLGFSHDPSDGLLDV
jgi:hypothetical protein